MVCATQDDPAGWLNIAVAEAWSVRQLKNAINEGKPEKTDLEIAQMIWDKVCGFLENRSEGSDWLKLRLMELHLTQD